MLVEGETNDIVLSGEKQILDDIHKLIIDSQHTNLLMDTLPMRHDAPELDYKIIPINLALEKLANQYQNVNILPLHLLPRNYFT